MNSPLSNKSQLRTSTSTRQICHPPRNLSDRVEQSATSALFPLVIGECCRKQEFKRTLTHSLCLCVTDKEYQPGKAGSLAGFYAGGISCCWDVYHVVSTVKERCRCRKEGRRRKFDPEEVLVLRITLKAFLSERSGNSLFNKTPLVRGRPAFFCCQV